MRSVLTFVLCCVTTVLAAGAAGPADDVKARYAVLAAAIGARDLAKIGTLYSADATLRIETPKGQDRVTGLESVMEMWQGAIRDGAVSFAATVTEATVKSDVLTESGTFVIKKKAGEPFLKGTYSGAWRRENGVWKVTSHHFVGQ